MSHPHRPFDCTSAELEKAVLSRYRSLVTWLPSDCRVFREPWDCSTVLCLDFAKCPYLLPVVKMESQSLIETAQLLGLANAIVFRIGNKFMGWQSTAVKPS
ncbi:MAG: hypothetical protein VKJ02_11415 [Snowella sp.]|nr:hypothetical protein [Snowella sp.]